MQPSLVLSALALATLMKSSEIEHGAEGRRRALYLRDRAQATLEEACTAQAVDFTLAEAALVSFIVRFHDIPRLQPNAFYRSSPSSSLPLTHSTRRNVPRILLSSWTELS